MYQLNIYEKYTMVSKGIVIFLFTMLCIIVSVPQAFAHRVIIIAYAEGNTVFVECGFDDGIVCNNAIIEVFDPSGNKLMEGRTDENGKFSFRPSQRTDLRLVIDAGMGHRDEHIMRAGELPELADETPKPQKDTTE